MRKKALELSCYVIGAGAFGVFLRWLQMQAAVNELGLVDKSVFNVIFPLYVAAAAIVFLRFLQQDDRAHLSVPEDFSEALGNDRMLFIVLTWVAAGVMIVGALLLLSKSETDKFVKFLRVLSALAVLTGVSLALLLDQARRETRRPTLDCLLALVPVFFFAAWLIYLYRVNSINSVLWTYVPEILAVIMAMVTFARLAGFAFDTPKGSRARFDVMFGAMLCLTELADDRYMGMQLMLLSTALFLVLFNWAMVCNLRAGQAQPQRRPSDGFEHLG